LKRLTDKETIEEIHKHIPDKDPVTREYLYEVRQSIKRDSFNWYNKLREGKYDYVHEFKERINEVHWLQQQHYKIIKSNENNPRIQQTSLAELHKLNITLANYLDVLPSIIGNNQNASTVSAPLKESSTEQQPRETIIV